MYRCAIASTLGALLALTTLGSAPSTAHAQEQVQRQFPATALRGLIEFGAYPEIALNGQATRLSPGSRLRQQNNLLATPASLAGQRWTVHYTFEPTTGLVQDVWILRQDEMARRPWPTTPAEASAWRFDPAAQVWTRP